MADYADMLLSGPKAQPEVQAGKPTSYADMLLSTPQAPAPEIVNDVDRSADVSDIAVASLANDPQAQIRYFAKQRGIPEDRYQVVNGTIVYQGDDGKLYREIPSGYSPEALLKRTATGVGPAIPAVTGTVAGITSAPLLLGGPAGLAGSMGITALAGAGGQTAREALAAALMDQEISPSRIAIEAGAAGLSQGIGGGLVRLGQRTAAQDLAKLDRPAMQGLEQKAQQQGIQLTPAESSNLASLKARQKALGNLPQTADKMSDFYTKRTDQVQGAVTRMLDDVSPVDSAEVAGKQIKGAAESAIDAAKTARSRAARPLYEKVVSAENVIPEEKFSAIAGDEFTASIIQKVKSDPLFGMRDLPDNSMPVLDAVKKQFDDLIEVAKRAGENNRVRLLTERRDNLLTVMDDAYPDYKTARAAFAGLSPEVDALEEGVVGVIKNLPDGKLQQAAQRIFNPATAGPRSVSEARRALEKSHPEAWQAIKRSWLQQNWEKAGRQSLATGSDVVNQGPKFRALLLGDEGRRRVLQAALAPKEWKALNDLADVLEAAGRVKPVGSDTAWNQEMMKIARQEGTPVLAKFARAFRPQDWGRLVEEWATERGIAKNADKLADIITQPGASEKLKQLRVLSPSSARFRAALGHFLTTFVRAGAAEAESGS